MLDINILKNPIIIAILAAAVTYLYMYWENEQRKEKDPKAEHSDVSYWPPLIVGSIVGLVAYGFLYDSSVPSLGVSTEASIDREAIEMDQEVLAENAVEPVGQSGGEKGNFGLGNINSIGTVGSESYHLIGRKNIRLPNTDVFIDIAKF